jgi:hypothetical protein
MPMSLDITRVATQNFSLPLLGDEIAGHRRS